ncbi:hypothetical protein [Serratia marcescens]|uniref:hypothetical protein n=1 Tax=Serratia marcescens TaxID=615 RepID=UPI000A46CF80|nr:hypothetical protein [Serratia marcescens]
MAFSLEQATRAQRPLLAVMLSDCLRELGADGDYPYLPLYWREVGRYPYLILSDRQTAGFALVRCLDSATVEMAEFYVKPEWRRTGPPTPCSRSTPAAGRCRSARRIRAGWHFGAR